MEVNDVISQARDALTVKRVFGEPYEQNGVTVIPAARVQGGAGGGGGEGPDGQGKGSGSGFGLNARPVGAFLIRGDEVMWRPAVDLKADHGKLAVLKAETGIAGGFEAEKRIGPVANRKNFLSIERAHEFWFFRLTLCRTILVYSLPDRAKVTEIMG